MRPVGIDDPPDVANDPLRSESSPSLRWLRWDRINSVRLLGQPDLKIARRFTVELDKPFPSEALGHVAVHALTSLFDPIDHG